MTVLRGIKSSGGRADFIPSPYSALEFSVFTTDLCHFVLQGAVSVIKGPALMRVSEVAKTITVGLSACLWILQAH